MPDYLPLPPPETARQNTNKELNKDEEEKRLAVLDHFSNADYKLPGVEDNANLTEIENFWLTDECLRRYLRASKWVVATAIHRLEDTLKWRREYGLYDLMTAEHVEPESLTGKEILFGYDTAERPSLLMIPSRQNTEESPRQLHYAVWMMERAIDLMGPGVETLALLINFGDRGKNPSLGVARTMLNIIQNHYPERLGRAIIINVPFIVNAFFKIIMPFVDPVTRDKIKFNPNVVADGLFTQDNLIAQWWGGDRDFEWDHAKYWPHLVEICEARRAEQMKRWRELGGTVGLSEWAIKGGKEE